ncbi:MAG TPA: RNA-binding protein [Thermoanaerobaculia bacterium]|nr:RNA-binding protein [Thermoanaerobaculia bacterium]
MTPRGADVRLLDVSKPPREQEPEEMADESLSAARSILERVTGEKLTKRSTRNRAKKGADARAANLTPERRKEIATQAAAARWKK